MGADSGGRVIGHASRTERTILSRDVISRETDDRRCNHRGNHKQSILHDFPHSRQRAHCASNRHRRQYGPSGEARRGNREPLKQLPTLPDRSSFQWGLREFASYRRGGATELGIERPGHMAQHGTRNYLMNFWDTPLSRPTSIRRSHESRQPIFTRGVAQRCRSRTRNLVASLHRRHGAVAVRDQRRRRRRRLAPRASPKASSRCIPGAPPSSSNERTSGLLP